MAHQSTALTKEGGQGIVSCVKCNPTILPCEWILMECMTLEQPSLSEGASSSKYLHFSPSQGKHKTVR
jgi:hypothetical protein